jgi:hypothetical protein
MAARKPSGPLIAESKVMTGLKNRIPAEFSGSPGLVIHLFESLV